MDKNTIPVIVGAAQFTQHKKSEAHLDPLSLMAKVCQEALKDIDTKDFLKSIDGVYVTNIFGYSYRDAPEELSKILNIEAKDKFYSSIGGNTPQMLVNKAAKAISTKENQAILITGGESYYTLSQVSKGRIKTNWPKRKRPQIINGENFIPSSKMEIEYGLSIPSQAYAIMETALRSKLNHSLSEHEKYIGNLYEQFSKIASNNPYAWNRISYSASEIITSSKENRIICHPFTKRMISNLYVDQSAALILTNVNMAEKFGIDEKLWVYPMGGSDFNNINNLTQRPLLYDSPAIRYASQLALKQAGLNLTDIGKFDLYSCFPCMVSIAKKEIGIPEKDPRPLTITGGLSFFGGPFNNYSMHAIITAVDQIRKNSALKVMVLANGGYNTKESIGIYGTEPPAFSWTESDGYSLQQSIYSKSTKEPILQANGVFIIEAYTIIYNRMGMPERGVVIGKLEDGSRTIAEIENNSKKLKFYEHRELIGCTGIVNYDPEKNRNILVIDD